MASSVIGDVFGGPYPETGVAGTVVEDRLLIAGLQAGEEYAYELLIQRFQHPVYNLALRLVSDRADAGDIVQEVFLKVFRNIHSFRGQSSLRTWIYRIAVNEAHNRRRWIFRHKHKEIGMEEHADAETRERMVRDTDPSPYDRALNNERHELIENALTLINPCFREAVVLRDLEDLNYDEIAEILNISIGTVKSRITRGREALRQHLTVVLRPELACVGNSHMSDDLVRRALRNLPQKYVPADVTARLRVIASHERNRRATRRAWLERLTFQVDHLWRSLAVPATGGLLSSVLLFSSMVSTLNVKRYLTQDIPLGIYTQVSVGDLSPFAGDGADVMVEVTIDPQGRVSNFSIPNGQVSKDQLRQIGNLILFSTFTPATAYGQPVSGKILVALHHINVRG